MKKLLFFITFILTLIQSNISQCMEAATIDMSQRQHYPIYLPTMGHQSDARTMLTDNDYDEKEFYHVMNAYSDHYPIHVVANDTPTERNGVCFSAAVPKFLGLEDSQVMKLQIPGAEDWLHELGILQKHCVPVLKKNAQPGDLVLYARQSKRKKNIHTIEHAALYRGNDIVESKFGTFKRTYKHPIWFVVNGFGHTAFIFKLTDKAKNDKQLLFDDLCTTAHQHPGLRAQVLTLHKAFFAAAAGKIQPIFPENQRDLNDDLEELLIRYPVININNCNQDGETALDLATRRGDIPCVKTLLNFKAIPHPNTLKLATAHKHVEIVQLLEAQMPE